jgi:hypothetical protein|tara:strand:+ start:1281 stop:1502 length:222 start_codon:yes stop_codon:yes gene_type:complete
MCAPRRSAPPPPPPPAPVVTTTPVTDSAVPELDLAIETEGQEEQLKKKKKRVGKKSLRTDVTLPGTSSLNVPK